MKKIKITTIMDTNLVGPLFDHSDENPILGLSMGGCCCCTTCCCATCCCCSCL